MTAQPLFLPRRAPRPGSHVRARRTPEPTRAAPAGSRARWYGSAGGTRAGAAGLLAVASLVALCLHAAHGPHLADAGRARPDATALNSPHGHGAAGRDGASHAGGAAGAHPAPDVDPCGVVAGLPHRADHGPPPIAVALRPGALFAATAASAPPDAPCRGDPRRLRALLQVFLV